MANGKWQMADGRWQMADGRWQMADGRWQIVIANRQSKINLPIFRSINLPMLRQL
jgi:2-amino-4-hydroxy-6-hydroxymethyldihydropteridine diphosphokinase